MTELIPGIDTTTVCTAGGNFQGRKVIITAGPWAVKILKGLGLDLPITVSTMDDAFALPPISRESSAVENISWGLIKSVPISV
jgi:glycine/D-amino acid oxidase-like deaminating enzyme